MTLTTGQPGGASTADRLRISKFTRNLYLGSFFDVRDAAAYDRLRLLGVTAIANLTPDDFGAEAEGFTYFQAGVDDSTEIPAAVIHDFITWVDAQIELGHTILVHCHAGISRTPSFLIAWLMHTRGCTARSDLRQEWSAAEDLLARCRPIIQPHYLLKQSVLRYFQDHRP